MQRVLHHNLNSLSDAIRTFTAESGDNPLPIHIETSGVDKLTGSPRGIHKINNSHAIKY